MYHLPLPFVLLALGSAAPFDFNIPAPVLQSPSKEYVILFVENAVSNTTNYINELVSNELMLLDDLIHEYSFGFAARLDNTIADIIQELPEVDVVEENKLFSIYDTQNNVPSWGLSRTSQRDYMDETIYNYPSSAGLGVNIYVVDSGINVGHVDFGGRAKLGLNVVLDEPFEDLVGHGTHVASTAGGTTYGIAKKANIFAVKVMNAQGNGYTSDIIKGIDWAFLHFRANGRRGGAASIALDNTVKAVIRYGLPVVVAAGNDFTDACGYSPARVPAAITVGATTVYDEFAYDFSNYGLCVSVLAPGEQITGAWIGSVDAQNTISGTSMATPHVTGVVALFLSESEGDSTPSPAVLKQMVLSAASQDYIDYVPQSTVNLLLFNNYTEFSVQSLVVQTNDFITERAQMFF